MDFVAEIKKALKKETGKDFELEIPANQEFGDYAIPCFILAKKYKKDPKQIAEELEAKLEIKGVEINAIGPYLNFFVDKSTTAKEVLTEIFKKENYGKGKDKKETVVIDFSAPNIAKPFHVGHLRSTVIGNSLTKVYAHLGYKVIGINHIGDWGTPFGKYIVAYKKWGSATKLKKEPIKHLMELYVKFNKQATKKMEDEAREWFKKLEDGNKEATKLWKLFRDSSLEEFERVYQKLNIKFDKVQGESFYEDKMPGVITALKRANLLKQSDGAEVVKLGRDEPPCLIKKSDGATTYALRDLAAATYRLKEYKAKKVLYVVDARQSLHFEQVFKVMAKLKKPKVFEHVKFGLMSFKGKAMATREGKVILLDDLISKSEKLVKKTIQEKNPKLKNKTKVAEQVGVGAIIFNDLFNDRIHDITFDWDKVLDFEGSTGPYVQYAHARCNSLLKKYGKKVNDKIEFELLNEDSETALLKILKKFPETLEEVTKNNKPSILAKYMVKLAQTFNNFYGICYVITEDEKLTQARILLVYCVKRVLEKGLTLLGLSAPSEM